MAEEESLSSFNSWSSSRCRDIFSFSTEALSQEASSCFDLSRADSFDILTQLYLESSGQSSLQTAATEQSQIQMNISETSHDSLKDLTDCLFQSHQNPSSESTMDEEVQILSPQFDCLIPSQTSLFWSTTDTPAKLNATAPRDSFLPEAKKLRLETPSPLPTFKVRKEKLGDRITALQQLVSPFGKTDTASVLHEAIEYIKFLHQQVNILERQHKNGKCWGKKDLRSLGLCLVPISSTAAVTRNEVPPLDFFWTQLWGSPQ